MSGRKGRGARPKIEGGGYQPEPPIAQGTPPQGGSALAPGRATAIPPEPSKHEDPPPAPAPRPAMLRFRCHAEGNVRLVSPAEVERDGGVWCPMCGNQMSRDPWG